MAADATEWGTDEMIVGVAQDGTAHHGELSPTYRQQHFLISLALAELASAAFELPSPALHARAANLVRNLITAHDWDPRYNSNTTDLSCKVIEIQAKKKTVVPIEIKEKKASTQLLAMTSQCFSKDMMVV